MKSEQVMADAELDNGNFDRRRASIRNCGTVVSATGFPPKAAAPDATGTAGAGAGSSAGGAVSRANPHSIMGATMRAKLLRARFSRLLTVPRLHSVISAISS